MRENFLDHWILAGRDPLRPVYLLRFVRLQYAVAVAIAIVLCFNGFLYWSMQQRAHEECVQRNQRTVLSVKVLDQLTAASRADGDRNASAVWNQWAATSRATPLPQC